MTLGFEHKCKVQKFVKSTCSKYYGKQDSIYKCDGCPLKENDLRCGWKGVSWTNIDFNGIWKYMREEYLRRHPEVLAEMQKKHPNDSRFFQAL